MSAHDNGGPAFPRVEPSITGEPSFVAFGLSVRDYFAVHADVPWSAAAQTYEIAHNSRPDVAEFSVYVASLRYAMADAMLAERAKVQS